MAEKEFVPGLFIKERRENTPEFVKMSISVKRADMGNFLRSKNDEWINIDIKESKNGKMYAEVNNFVPDQSKARAAPDNSGGDLNRSQPAPDDYDPDSIPF